MNFEDAVHLAKVDTDTPMNGHHMPFQRGAYAKRNDRTFVRRADLDDC